MLHRPPASPQIAASQQRTRAAWPALPAPAHPARVCTQHRRVTPAAEESSQRSSLLLGLSLTQQRGHLLTLGLSALVGAQLRGGAGAGRAAPRGSDGASVRALLGRIAAINTPLSPAAAPIARCCVQLLSFATPCLLPACAAWCDIGSRIGLITFQSCTAPHNHPFHTLPPPRTLRLATLSARLSFPTFSSSPMRFS